MEKSVHTYTQFLYILKGGVANFQSIPSIKPNPDKKFIFLNRIAKNPEKT